MKDIILQYAKTHETFSARAISAECDLNIVTLRQYLSALFREGKLNRVGRGLYSEKKKQDFVYRPSKTAKDIYGLLTASLPFANFCVYDGTIIVPIQHHLSINNAIYVETDRDVVDTVFGKLREGRKDVFRQPDSKFVHDYIELKSQCIIVKTLVSESPTVNIEGIVVPTLEKMLVDTQSDADFDYLRGAESQYMYNQALDLYPINLPRLFRYARRRNIEQYIKKLIYTAQRYDQ